MNDWRLSTGDTLELINMYKTKECLWNYKSHLYKRSDLKRKAWEEIAQYFNKDPAEIRKKLKYLRSAYVNEKKKVDFSKKSGMGIEDVYETHLFYFKEFSFLDNIIVIRATQTNLSLDDTLEPAEEVTEDLRETERNEEIYSPSTLPTAKTSSEQREKQSGRRRNASRSIQIDDAIASILNTTVSEPDTRCKYDVFGSSVASQLTDLSPTEAAVAMADVQKVLSNHTIRSLSKKTSSSSSSSSAAPTTSLHSSSATLPSSLSSSGECNDPLQSAMLNSNIYDEFIEYSISD